MKWPTEFVVQQTKFLSFCVVPWNVVGVLIDLQLIRMDE
jgi:hypothetical protein